MQFKKPKNNDKYYWTEHVHGKMIQYGISEQTVRRIIRNPERVEEGVAEDTIASMQTRGKKSKYELWVMYQGNDKKPGQVKVITTWKYPGVSPTRDSIPIPPEIMEELNVVL